MKILNELTEWVELGLINQETADNIRQYYAGKNQNSTQRILMIFGVLGAVLIGLGFILIVAHNWDNLTHTQKTIFAVLPLIISQIGAGYVLWFRPSKVIWKEITSIFIFFSVAAAISLIAQIYNIPGNLPSFLLTWMLLVLPLVYVMPSQMVSLFFIIGITYYANYTSFWEYPQKEPYEYWGLLFAILPNYYWLIKNKKNSNVLHFHHWLIAISVIISLGTLSKTDERWMFSAYLSLFAIYFLIGNSTVFQANTFLKNPYRIIGFLGTVILLLIVSFDWFWTSEGYEQKTILPLMTLEFTIATLLTLLAVFLIFAWEKPKKFLETNPTVYISFLFYLTYLLGHQYAVSQVFINIFLLIIGVYYLLKGANMGHIGYMNLGLLTISALIIFRFFDTQISFVVRGILFLVLGLSFFGFNYWLIKKKKNEEQ